MNNENEVVEILKTFIPKGKENAIHQKELAILLCEHPSRVKKMIQEVRQKGELEICSGPQGYWIAKDEEEIKEFAKRLDRQAYTRLKTSRPMKDTLKQDKNQLHLFENLKEVSKGGEDGKKEK